MNKQTVKISFILLSLFQILSNRRSIVAAQAVTASWQSSPLTSTVFEGQETPYVSFQGSNGLRLAILLPLTASTVPFDYSLMFWFRLTQPPSDTTRQQTLFEIPQGPSCFLTLTHLNCNTGQSLDLASLPNSDNLLQKWTHLTYTTNRFDKTSTLILNYPLASRQLNGSFMDITTYSVALGISQPTSTSEPTSGLQGDVRDFYLSVGKVSQQVVQLVMNMKKVFELSCMAYYQFDTTIGQFKDTYRNQQAVVIVAAGGDQPKFQVEQTTETQCSTFEDNSLDELPTFQPSYKDQTISIPNFKGLQTGYAYTFSMWLKNGGGQKFSTSTTDGIDNLSFFTLKGVFSMWFDSSTSFKVFVDANQNLNKFTSPSVFIPLNEWVNIQMTLSQLNGLAVLVYNSNGAQIQSMRVSNVLGTQTPINQATLLDNFDGAVKSLFFWDWSYPLPLSNPTTQQNLKLSFDFSAKHFSGNQWKSTPIIGSSLSGLPGSGFWFSQMQIPSFYSIDFTNPSKLGTLSATSTLWDGLGCQSKKKYNNYYGTLQQTILMKETGSLTAELWFQFKEKQLNSTRVDLIRLSTGSEDSLMIYIENGVLKCAPFGPDDENSVLVYKGVQTLNTFTWQHVSCGFTQSSQLLGQYLSYNPQTSTTLQSILPLSFSKSIAYKKNTAQGQLESTQVLVGSSAISLALREVRVWSELRSAEQLFAANFKQVELTDANLQLNYKLMDGNLTIKNQATSGGVAKTSEITLNSVLQNQTGLVICSVDQYFDFRVQGCVGMPFDLMPITQIAQLSLQNGFQNVLTNQFLRSPILFPSFKTSAINQQWSLSDKTIDRSYVFLQRNQSNLLLNPITLADGSKYNLTSVLTGAKNNFWLTTTQSFYPRKCSYLADQTSKQSFNKLTVLTNQSTSICFNMSVLSVDGCYQNSYNILQSRVSVQSQPSIADLESIAKISINKISQQVQVCFERSAVAQFLPQNQVLNLIFSTFWSDKEQSVPTESSTTVVYELSLATPIIIEVRAKGNFINQQDSVIIDASNSSIGGVSNKGLVFKWICPQVFQQVCEQFEMSPVIEITESVMSGLIGVKRSQDYVFTVQIWALGFGDEDIEAVYIFKKNVVVNWSKIIAPRVNIMIDLVQGQQTPAIVATQHSSAHVQIYNYPSSDPNLRIDWQISSSNFNADLIAYSSDNSTIYFKKGALQSNLTYTLTVKVTIKDGQSGQQDIKFQTGLPPNKGQFTVSPATGIMFATNFEIKLYNWTSTQQLKATIFGITQFNPHQKVQITQNLLPISSTGSFQITTILPQIVGLQLEVFGQTGEKVVETLNLTSARQPPTNVTWSTDAQGLNKISWSIVAKELISSNQTKAVQKYLFMSSIAQDCQKDLLQGLTNTSDCIEASNKILTWVTSDLQSISSDDVSINTTSIVSASANILAHLTMNIQDSNSSIGAYNMLQILSSKTNAFFICLADQNFKENFAVTISNLAQYASSQITPRIVGQMMLQQDSQSMLNGLIVQKNFLLDKLCLQSDRSSINVTGQFLQTYKFYLLNDFIQDFTIIDQQFANQTILIPVRSILNAHTNRYPQSTKLCVQISSMVQNPVPSYLFTNQTIFNASFVQISTIDDQGNRLLNSDIGVSNLYEDQFQLSFNFDFDRKLFTKGQTSCLAYNSNNLPSRWNTSLCTTSYTSTQIICTCSTINNFYFAIGNDLTLENKDSFWDFTYQWRWQYFIILATLSVFVIGLPCIGINLDKKDYQAIEKDQFKVSEETLQYLCKTRSDTYKCEQELYYKLKDIEIIQGWKALTFCNFYQLIRLNVHPLWSFLWRFDYEVKRLMRVGILMSHVSVITLFIFAIYSKGIQAIHPSAPYIVTFVVGLLSLPVPDRYMTCFKTKMVQVPAANQQQNPGSTIVSTPQEMALENNNWFCKVLLYIFTTLIQILAVVISACFTFGAQNSQVSFRLSEKDGEQAVIIWFCTLIWGLLVLQEIKIVIVTVMSLKKATRMFKNGEENVYSFCSSLLTPQNVIELCLDALYVIKFQKEGGASSQLELEKAESSQTEINQKFGDKSSIMGNSTWLGNQTNLVQIFQASKDKMQVNHQSPRVKVVTFNDRDSYRDSNFEVEQDLPSKRETIFSDEEIDMELPLTLKDLKGTSIQSQSQSRTPHLSVNKHAVSRLQQKHNRNVSDELFQGISVQPRGKYTDDGSSGQYKSQESNFNNKGITRRGDEDEEYGQQQQQLQLQLEDVEIQQRNDFAEVKKTKKDKKSKKEKKEKKHKKDKKIKREPDPDISQ